MALCNDVQRVLQCAVKDTGRQRRRGALMLILCMVCIMALCQLFCEAYFKANIVSKYYTCILVLTLGSYTFSKVKFMHFLSIFKVHCYAFPALYRFGKLHIYIHSLATLLGNKIIIIHFMCWRLSSHPRSPYRKIKA